MLERRHPDRWGKRKQNEITDRAGDPIQIEDVREKLLNKLNQLAETKGQQKSIRNNQKKYRNHR